MALSSKANTSSYQVRSISFPCKSHPSISKVEEGLKKLETRGASTFMVSNHTQRLSSLKELYEDVEELLHLPTIQQAFSHCRNEKWVDQVLDASVTMLDICGITRDMVSQIIKHGRDLQCSLRRKKGEYSIENSIERFSSFRKKIQRDAKKAIGSLKKVDNEICALVVANLDHQLVAIVRVLLEVSKMTASIFKSIIFLFSIKSKPSKWSIVSKMMHKGRVGCEDQQGIVSEFENVDVALINFCKNVSSNEGGNIQIAQIKLEAMESSLESIENGLDCLFRHLVRTRALLLNIMSM